MTQLVLGSSSPARAAILKQVRLPFSQYSPDVDETPRPNEHPIDLVKRLSIAKAQAIMKQHAFPEPAVIITADQVALFDEQPIGKPHTKENAIHYLKSFSGKPLTFYSGVSLLNTANNHQETHIIPTTVTFKTLSDALIEYYLDQEKPFKCAAALKSEGLGMALIEKIESTDPTALIGLPALTLFDFLAREGIALSSIA